MPDLAARSGVESPAFIGAGDVHNAFDHNGRVFDGADIGYGEGPFRRHTRDVGLADLREFAEAIAAGVAVVGGPVRL